MPFVLTPRLTPHTFSAAGVPVRRYSPPSPPFLQGQIRCDLGDGDGGYPLLHKQCVSLDANYMLQTEMFAAGWSDGTVSVYSVGGSAPCCNLPLKSGHAAIRVRWLPFHKSALMVLDASQRFSVYNFNQPGPAPPTIDYVKDVLTFALASRSAPFT